MFNKILVPYDGSDQSQKALDHAARIASDQDSAEIILLHVVENITLPPLAGDKSRSYATGEVIDRDALQKEIYLDRKKHALKMLEDSKSKIRHIRCSTVVLYGHPSDSILKYAAEEQVDLIVIGNIGLSGMARLQALGSVSRAVAERSQCPVMIVH